MDKTNQRGAVQTREMLTASLPSCHVDGDSFEAHQVLAGRESFRKLELDLLQIYSRVKGASLRAVVSFLEPKKLILLKASNSGAPSAP